MQAVSNEFLLTSLNQDVAKTQNNQNLQAKSNEQKLSFETLLLNQKELKLEKNDEINSSQVKSEANENKIDENVSKKDVKDLKEEKKAEKDDKKTLETKDEKVLEDEINIENKDETQINIVNLVQSKSENKKAEKIDENEIKIEVENVDGKELLLKNAEISSIKNQKTFNKEDNIVGQININQTQNKKIESEEIENFFEKSQDVQKTSKNENESVISVKDLRTQKSQDLASDNSDKKMNVEVKMNNSNTATITMEYANNASEQNILSLNNQTASSDGSNFQAMLNNQIAQNVPEFVKAGSVILKDNNQGTINLILRPDDLGNVKIHLSLDGKTINGSIVVATKEAMEVFKDNAQTLREAFVKNGFDAADFNVSYNNNNSSQNNNGDFTNQFEQSSMMAKKIYTNNSGNLVETVSEKEVSSKNDKYSINIVA